MGNNLPTILEFQLTLNCQYNCAHCGNVKDKKQNSEPTFEKVVRVIDCINPVKISFTGGEPTLKWDLLLNLIQYASSRGIAAQLNTNARMLDENKIHELEDSGLKIFHVSLSTLNPKRYQAIRRTKDPTALEHLLSVTEFSCQHTSLKVIPEVMLLKSNLQEIEHIYSLVASWGAHEFEVQNVIPTDQRMWRLIPKDTEVVSMLKSLFARRVSSTKITLCCLHLTPCYSFPDFPGIDGVDLYKCVCGREGAYVSVTGDVYPCSFFHERIGNAFDEDFSELWQESALISRIQTELPVECQGCNSFTKCRNVCMAVTYNKYGRFDKRSYPIYSTEQSLRSR